MDASWNVYSYLRWDLNHRDKDLFLEVSMTHLPGILRAGILLPRELDVLLLWYSEVVKAPTLQGYYHSHRCITTFIHTSAPVSEIDGNAVPGLAPCHGIQPRARSPVRRAGEGGGCELYRRHCKSLRPEFTRTQCVRKSRHPWQLDAVSAGL